MSYTKRSLYHGWLPQYQQVYESFLREHIHAVLMVPSLGHKDSVQKFADTIHASPVMTKLFDMIFLQVNKDPKWAASNPEYRVRDFEHLLLALDSIVDKPPQFYKVKNEQGETIGEPIGVPIYLVFDLLMNTSAAYDLFRMPEFNLAMKTLLDSWGEYLRTDGSNSSLNDGPRGWYSPAGMSVLEAGLGKWTFDQTYVTDPSAGIHRFKSWDDFFVRELKATGPDDKPLRPIHGDGRLPLLYNACESTVFRTASNVQLHDTFWLKTQNYSLYDMLGGENYPDVSCYATDFVGGYVFQAFLSPQDFHRWHSPVGGKVIKTKVLEGTYYAVLPDDGAPPSDPDIQPGDPHGALIRSQPWLSIAATRAVYIIEPDPVHHIKKICFIPVGMVEVSTCQITVDEGAHVDVGQQIGMFHFGGSTYALIIQPEPGYEILFQDLYDSPMRPGQHRWVNSVIGQIRQRPVIQA